MHKNIHDTSVREIRIASGELIRRCATITRTCTDSYIVLSDKLTKLASVQEANVTVTINGMQRYLELLVLEGEEENNSTPIKGKNQLMTTYFSVTTPRYSQVPRV